VTEAHPEEQPVDLVVDGPAAEVEHPERAATQLSVLPTPLPEPTGVPGVDAALDRLAELSELDSDPEQHVAVLEDVQDRLQGALSGPDESAP
jgi:hypothetical protein